MRRVLDEKNTLTTRSSSYAATAGTSPPTGYCSSLRSLQHTPTTISPPANAAPVRPPIGEDASPSQ